MKPHHHTPFDTVARYHQQQQLITTIRHLSLCAVFVSELPASRCNLVQLKSLCFLIKFSSFWFMSLQKEMILSHSLSCFTLFFFLSDNVSWSLWYESFVLFGFLSPQRRWWNCLCLSLIFFPFMFSCVDPCLNGLYFSYKVDYAIALEIDIRRPD